MENEAGIIQKIKDGDQKSFEILVDENQKSLFYLALRWTQSRYDAEDIVQKTFINAYSGIRFFKENSSIKTWLFQITLNLCKNYYRDAKRKNTVELNTEIISDNPTQHHEAELKDQTKKVLDLTGKLKEKQRVTLLLRLFEDLPFREIAQIMKCSENNAKVNFHFAIKNLRELLKKEGLTYEMSH